MPHVQRKDSFGELTLHRPLQSLCPVHQDLHGFGRVWPKATLGGLGTRPDRRRLTTRERRVQLLVDRSVQFPILTTLERIHHHHGDFLAVLAFVSFFTAFLAATRLPLRLAAMALTATRTVFQVLRLAFATTLGQFRRGGGGRAFSVHLDHQHL